MFARHAIYGSITALLLGSASAHAASAAQDGAVTRAGAAPQDQENNGSPENAGGLEQIIVTAERREANVQKTPVAITALSGAALAEKQVADLTDLKAPAFVFAEVLGAARIYVRGIGYESLSPGSESRVALYNDGVYVGRPSAGLANFYDVERVEVLRGPQGTLYGRNATAGAVNIITVDPGRNLKGFVSATVGNYGLLKTEGGVTVPLSDKISTRLSFQTVDRDGYGKHIQTGAEIDDAHSRAARLKMNVAASDDVNILLSADYSKSNDNTGGLHYIRPGSPDIVPVGIANGFLPPENVRD